MDRHAALEPAPADGGRTKQSALIRPTASGFTPSPLTLGEVHIWRIPLTPEPLAPEALDLLSAAEQARAARLCNPDHRHAWQQCRYAVRQILSRYCGQPARDLHFTLNPFGKPSLEGNVPAFNLSHAKSLAALAIASNEIGIDLEPISRQTDFLGLAQRFFAPAEAGLITRSANAGQADLFFQIWTRKEAFIKARGMGLSIPLDKFRVALEPTSAVQVAPEWDDGQHWYCHSIPLADDHVTSLSCLHRQPRWQIFAWESTPQRAG